MEFIYNECIYLNTLFDIENNIFNILDCDKNSSDNLSDVVLVAFL